MTFITHIRANLLSAALLLTTAIASPAFAESLPEISPRQIATDVERVQNPDTGAYEYIAPSFDPFEQDRSMAGSVGLRSVSAGTTINGQSIRGGALLDMSFYYNSSSNDPYDTRGFEEAAFLSGDYAPVTLRDNRILECNEEVRDVVYYHEDYYRPSLYVNLYRPYRYYSGHYLYDGFRGNGGYNYGRSFAGSRRFGTSSFSRSRNSNRNRNTRNNRRNDSRGGFTDRAADSLRGTNREGGAERRVRTDRNRADRDRARTRTRTRTGEDRRNIRNNRRNGENVRPNRPGGAASTPRRAVPQTARTATPQSDANSAAARAQRDVNRSRSAEKSKNAPRRNSTGKNGSQTRNKKSESRSSQSKNRSQPRSKNRTPARSQNRSRSRSQTRNRGRSKLKLINVLPMASIFSRNVVRNVGVHCAREELLTVHISQERLDAARFDGLTVLVLDRAGDEIPVYVPPNYIEGYRRAASGNVTPNVSYQEPRSSAPVTRGPVDRGPVYQAPPSRSGIESAACPAGTSKQADGTCLQGGTTTYGGYPTR